MYTHLQQQGSFMNTLHSLSYSIGIFLMATPLAYGSYKTDQANNTLLNQLPISEQWLAHQLYIFATDPHAHFWLQKTTNLQPNSTAHAKTCKTVKRKKHKTKKLIESLESSKSVLLERQGLEAIAGNRQQAEDLLYQAEMLQTTIHTAYTKQQAIDNKYDQARHTLRTARQTERLSRLMLAVKEYQTAPQSAQAKKEKEVQVLQTLRPVIDATVAEYS